MSASLAIARWSVDYLPENSPANGLHRLIRGDWRRARGKHVYPVNYFEDPELSALVTWVKALADIAARSEHTVPQLAVAWVLSRPEITAAIVGCAQAGTNY